jgi:F0F1-type ATP synthase membrane subunit a
MNYLVPAQAGAQLLSLIVYGAIARWYVVPWLQNLKRADALIALLWVHVFRYVALPVFSSQRDGFPISNGGAMDIVVGDVVGVVIAFIAIILLRRRIRAGVTLAWLLAAETVYDTVDNIRGGIQEHLMGAAGGATWLILVFFVPIVVVSLVLIVWQLYSRRTEALDREHPVRHEVRQPTMAGAVGTP